MKKSARRIDHFPLCVLDLERAKKTYEAMGFFMTPFGDHRPSLGTGNHVVTFEKNFLELLTIIDRTIPAAYLQEDVDRREGVHIMGFTSDDVDADIKTLREAQPGGWGDKGLSTRRMALQGSEIVVARTDYTIQPMDLGREIRFFIANNTTKEITLNPDFTNHPNGALGITEVLFAADDGRDVLIGDLELILGPDCKRETGDCVEFHTPEEVLVIKRRRDLDFKTTCDAPYLAGLSIAMANVDATAQRLRANDVPFEQAADGSVTIAPEHAHGICLKFVDEAR